ncbi:hypothetical protein [Ferrimonas marina]|nr:hypothetical protein [Ferrimonas marina]
MASAQASERLSLDLRASQVVEERGLMYCWYSNPEKTVNEMLVVTWGPGKECPIGILAMP